MRFNTPAEVKQWATETARKDLERHHAHGHDMNPYCTPGRRDDWERGFANKPPRDYERPEIQQYNTAYQRGRAMAEILKTTP